MAEGMVYLHNNTLSKSPIIHKDLKPAYMMVTKNKIVKIIDLDISGLTKM